MKLRALLLAGLTAFAVQTRAQTYTVVVNGTLSSCDSGSTVVVQDFLSLLSDSLTVGPGCTFSMSYTVGIPHGVVYVQGTCTNGGTAATLVDYDLAGNDTITLQVPLVCGPDVVDCQGVVGGGALIGTSCDDGDPATVFDTWDAACACVGYDSTNLVLDCLGQPFGPNMPGSPCIDTLNIGLPFGTWSANCQCLPDSSLFGVDCLGVVGGPNGPGAACDDGDSTTVFDAWDLGCQCVGFDPGSVVFDCLNIPNGGNLPGTPCFDNNLPFLFGTWDAACTCVIDSALFFPVDCQGVLNGPALPGSSCDDGLVNTIADSWDPNCICTGFDTTSFAFDCLGVPNGTALPGSACDDGLVNTINDAWSVFCTCAGTDTATVVLDCLGVPNGNNLPGTLCLSTGLPFIVGTWDASCTCVPDSSGYIDCAGVFNGPDLPGTPCNDGIGSTINDTWNAQCLCLGTDTTGNPLDCLGIPNGPNLPGTPCSLVPDSLNMLVGTWGTDCVCYALLFDCLGVPNGPNLPGTPCVAMDTLGPVLGAWDLNCLCAPDTTSYFDCAGVPNGPNLPNTPCNDGDPATVFDLWDGACTCIGYTTVPCEAGFEVLPSAPDTTGGQPITLWIMNTSFGGSAAFSYQWDFGDGASSTDMFPVHDYAGFGPYELCLTVDDGNGCSDTYCDTIGLDSNGFFRSSAGFTLAVMQVSTGTPEGSAHANALSLWPNPAQDELNIAFAAPMEGAVDLAVLDLGGRVLRAERIGGGLAGHRMAIDGLPAGVHLLRATGAGGTYTVRFVKVD